MCSSTMYMVAMVVVSSRRRHYPDVFLHDLCRTSRRIRTIIGTTDAVVTSCMQSLHCLVVVIRCVCLSLRPHLPRGVQASLHSALDSAIASHCHRHSYFGKSNIPNPSQSACNDFYDMHKLSKCYSTKNKGLFRLNCV